jgi:hypothetical protein
MTLKTFWIWIIGIVLYSYTTIFAQGDCCIVTIPEPFDKYTDVKFIRQIYPDFDAKTCLLGKGIIDSEGNPLGGQLYDAKIWKGEGEPKLLIMIETYTPENGQRPDYGAATYGIDLALFDKVKDELTLLAKLQNADTHSGHSSIEFDLAPYKVKPDLVAVGLRSSYQHMGIFASTLKLFLRSDKTFHPVFERNMEENTWAITGDTLEGDLSVEQMKEVYQFTKEMAYTKKATLQVVPGKGDYNHFKITENQIERQKKGTLAKKSITETWIWDAGKRAYIKQK